MYVSCGNCEYVRRTEANHAYRDRYECRAALPVGRYNAEIEDFAAEWPVVEVDTTDGCHKGRFAGTCDRNRREIV